MPADRAPLFSTLQASNRLGRLWVLVAVLTLWPASWHATWGQGGGNANAVGISLENSANAAAAQSTANAAGAGNSGAGSSTPGYPTTGYPTTGAAPTSDYQSTEMTSTSYDNEMASSGMGGPGYGAAMRGGGGMGLGSGILASSLAEFFNRPLPESALRYQPTLLEQAALAVHQGNQRAALALFHAHLVAERDAAASSLSGVGFSPLLKKPAWAVRLGISLNAKIPTTIEDGPQPIREGDKAATGRRGGPQSATGNAYTSESEPRSPAAAGGSSAETTQGADMSAELAANMEAHAGEAGMAVPPGMLPAAAGALASGARGGAAAGMPTIPGGDRTATAKQELDRYLGVVADIMNTELTQRISAGAFGMAWRELPGQGTALVQKLAGTGMSTSIPGSGQLPMWIPGVDYLGMVHPAQVIEKAKENEIDVLVHFEVGMKENRGTDPQYVVRCRVINVATGETLGASKLMDKRDVLLAARRSDVKTVVKDMLGPALEALDSKAAVQPMPQLAPQHAVSRIDALLGSRGAVRMSHLAEIVMFHTRGLIDDNQLDQAVFFAIAEDGLQLLYGEQEQRLELAARLVAGELDQE